MKQPAESQPTNQAFVIVDGERVILLDNAITNIGRKTDNDIVIAHENVSRYHAQIRKIKNHFVLLDLESTVGTSVNGKRVTQAFLKAGDVISVGGVPLIFGLGTPKSGPSAPSPRLTDSPTGPTDATDIESADFYIDLFNPPEDQ
jgi:pSer/pThr/pTyr-binding forkhead associated (FHA) protein